MKRITCLICGILLLASLCGCADQNTTDDQSLYPDTSTTLEPTATVEPTVSPSATTTVGDYFPMLTNVHYVYEGEGMEYAAYDVYIDYTSDTKIQERKDNTGTVMANVIELKDGKATRVFSREDYYYRENFLEKSGDRQEVLLMEPIEVGTAWALEDGRARTITDVAAQVETPAGTYTAVAVETTENAETGGTDAKTTHYYAAGVGLVKTVTAGEGYEITSTLSEIQQDTPLVQTIRFYYPNVEDDKIYYWDWEVGFDTNDVTRTKLEETYKEEYPSKPGDVFSENTKINSLYLNDDGMVYVDLSGEFVSEMNAGSGYETQILQSVANTFGSYYYADKVVLTIDGEPYQSGHMEMAQGDTLTVNTDGAIALT